jgi:hypothetical protein
MFVVGVVDVLVGCSDDVEVVSPQPLKASIPIKTTATVINSKFFIVDFYLPHGFG